MTDKERGKLLDSMIVLVDTREKENAHIIEYLELNNISYRSQKLDFGDYSYELPSMPHLNGLISVEKKNSLTEISGNLTKDRERFHREFLRAQESNAKLHLVIENATWKKIANGTYRSAFPPKSFIASLMAWNAHYNCPIWFIPSNESPELIYNILKYGVRDILKKIQNND